MWYQRMVKDNFLIFYSLSLEKIKVFVLHTLKKIKENIFSPQGEHISEQELPSYFLTNLYVILITRSLLLSIKKN